MAGLAHSSRRVHFGLGPVGFADSLTVVWPRGSRQDIALSSNIRSINLTEGRIPTRIIEGVPTVLNQPVVFSNFPNPFNPSVTINFELSNQNYTNISVYNLLGERIDKLVSDNFSAGNYSLKWDASAFPTGIYFLKFTTPSFSQTRKIMYLK